MKIDLTSDFSNTDLDNVMKLISNEPANNENELIASYHRFINYIDRPIAKLNIEAIEASLN
jgi:hypothetical protein